MASDMKITMLGPTGSGKTCYMLGMYAHMQFGMNGLTLSAEDPDDDLKLSNLWDRLVEVKDEKRWPPPNDNNPKTYAFDFNYGFQPMMQFEWLDYRGGAMSDYSTETDVQGLMSHLTSSSCIFLCISGEYLAEPLTSRVARMAKIKRMNRLMATVGQQVRPTSQQPFPVVIILTKYDLCSHREKEEVIADIKRLFQGLFTPHSGWLTMVCPVSLGKQLATDSNAGIIDPINIHLPVAFAVYAKLREYGLNLRNEQSGSRTNVEKLQKGFFSRFLQSGDIAQGWQRLQELGGQIDQIETNMRRLAQELKHTQIFLDGKEIQIG